MDRQKRLQIEQGRRLAEARQAFGFKSGRAAALEFGWPESSYSAHERGSRTIGQDDAERYARAFTTMRDPVTAQFILFGDENADVDVDERRSEMSAVVVGYVGAGAIIEAQFDDVPGANLERIDLPFAVPEGVVAFRVQGESMRPAYKDGDAVLVYLEQRRDTQSFIGEEAVVRTEDGRRYVKEIQRPTGRKRASYNLHSHNAKLIENVRIAWVGEILAWVKGSQIEALARANAARAGRRRASRERETTGMDELPLGKGAA